MGSYIGYMNSSLIAKTLTCCHLARIMGEGKIHTAVARETGSCRATMTFLYKEMEQKINLEAIEKLWLLLECQASGPAKADKTIRQGK